jgi:hypothetical protein
MREDSVSRATLVPLRGGRFNEAGETYLGTKRSFYLSIALSLLGKITLMAVKFHHGISGAPIRAVPGRYGGDDPGGC